MRRRGQGAPRPARPPRGCPPDQTRPARHWRGTRRCAKPVVAAATGQRGGGDGANWHQRGELPSPAPAAARAGGESSPRGLPRRRSRRLPPHPSGAAAGRGGSGQTEGIERMTSARHVLGDPPAHRHRPPFGRWVASTRRSCRTATVASQCRSCRTAMQSRACKQWRKYLGSFKRQGSARTNCSLFL